MLRTVLLAAPALIAVGCSCNQDYSFPPVDGVVSDPPDDFGSWLALRTAPDGRRLTMSYYDRERTGFGFAVGTVKEGGGVDWAHERVDGYPEADGLDRGDRGKYGTHQVAPDGTVYAAYQDSQNGVLRAAIRKGTGNWEATQADVGTGLTSTGAGGWVSMAIQSNGLPMVAHADLASGVLRVSRLKDDGTWESETAWSGNGDVGRYANLFIVGETAYIAFYEGTNGNLELLEGTFGAWTHSQVDVSGDVGQWPSIWADGDELMIAYHHVSNQDLKLARRISGSWTTEVIDDGEYRGADTALFLRDGLPAIVYFDGQNNDMWMATTDGTSWTREKLAGDEGAVGFHNEVAQAGGQWFVGSYDFTARTLYSKAL
jgi:hypothetical protein